MGVCGVNNYITVFYRNSRSNKVRGSPQRRTAPQTLPEALLFVHTELMHTEGWFKQKFNSDDSISLPTPLQHLWVKATCLYFYVGH